MKKEKIKINSNTCILYNTKSMIEGKKVRSLMGKFVTQKVSGITQSHLRRQTVMQNSY